MKLAQASIQEFGNLVALLRARAARTPERPSISYLLDGERETLTWTYAEIDARARAVAVQLQRLGAAGQRAVLVYGPGLDFIAGFFGCLYAGVVAVPAYPPDPARLPATLPRLLGVVADAQAGIILTTRAIAQLGPMLAQQAPQTSAIRWIATDGLSPEDGAAWQEPDITADSLAYLQYTSGSTSSPKGVMISHGNALANLAQLRQTFKSSESDVGMLWLPVFHNFGLVSGVLQPIFNNFPLTFMSPLAFLEKPARWLQAMSRLRATTTGAPNFAFELCARAVSHEDRAGLDLSALRMCANGAEPVRVETLDRFVAAFGPCGFRREAFKPGFGMAETTLGATVAAVDVLPSLDIVQGNALERNRRLGVSEAVPGARTFVSNGPPLPGVQVLVVRPESRTPCGADEIGEIWLAGPNIAKGYWQKPEETARVFGAMLADGSGPFLRTGDLGYVHEGEVYIAGRQKDLIVVRGHNHYPQDIERTVEQCHPSIRPFAVCACSLEVDGEERLLVVAEVDGAVQPSELGTIAGAIRRAVSGYHELQVHTVAFVQAGTIPKTASQKIQRFACRDAFVNGRLALVGTDAMQAESVAENTMVASLSRAALAALSSDERQSYVEKMLVAQIAGVLKCPPARIDRDSPLASLGLDSMQIVELKHRLEVGLGLSVPVARLLEGPSVAVFAPELLAHVLSGSGNAPVAQAWESAPTLTRLSALKQEVHLDAEIAGHGRPFAVQAAPRELFLTGATGYVGVHLLSTLLRATPARVHCLVRAADAEAGLARIRQMMEQHQLWEEAFARRIVAVPGDLSAPRLGLSPATFAELAEKVDAVFHSGAAVNFLYPYSALRATNVDGTREALRLTTHGRLKPFHFVSTVGVLMSGGYPAGHTLGEDEPMDELGELPNGYEQSKWVADQLVTLARSRGVPASSYRVGLVTGESESGAYRNLDEFLPHLIKGCIQLGVAPALDTDSLMVPVDYVCRTIVESSCRPELSGRTFHVNHPQPIRAKELIGWVNDRGYPLRAVPYDDWRQEVLKLAERGERDNALYVYLEYVLGLQERQAMTPQMDSANTTLAAQGIACPPLPTLLGRYFDHFVQVGFLPSPNQL